MKRFLYPLLGLLLLASCSSDDDALEPALRQATVTYLTTPNGLGDNGYNDAAAEGIFAFAFQSGTRLRMLQPNGEAEAERMYQKWLTDNADEDSAVLIIGSSVYEQMARRVSAQHQTELSNVHQRGGRVLMFETETAIDGITTMAVSRYGVSYLCGAMSGAFDALVLSAVKGNPILDVSVKGFLDGYNAHHAEDTRVEVQYLSDNETGFAMPDSAYKLMSARIAESFVYREMVFPLLGGSAIGVLRAMNDEEANFGLAIGMDVDQSAFSTRVPFSMIVHTGDVLHQYLDDWLEGREWPASCTLGMAEGGADVMLHPSFYLNNPPSDDRYRDSETFKLLYEQYKEEAMRKEKASPPTPLRKARGVVTKY